MSHIEIFDSRYARLKAVDWDFTDASQDSLASIHPYPARFIPDIPRELISGLGCDKGAVILDPFCGSGTTLLEAQRAGFESVGIDLNPIACLISSVKTKELPPEFLPVAHDVYEQAKNTFDGYVDIPTIPNLDHWFKPDVQKALSSLLTHIDEQSDVNLKNALKLALSSIIVRVSNQESDTRYAAIDNNYTANDVLESFLTACNKIHEAKKRNSVNLECSKIFNQDILSVLASDFDKPVGLVITSPPYPNPQLVDFKQVKSSGDAFLIATAMKYDLTVITEENKTGQKKIPFVCNSLGVPCVDILGLCEKEGWSF